jgi:hypothetical protein
MLPAFRHFNIEKDFSPLVEMRRETETIDQEGSPVTEQALSAQLGWPGHLAERDCWVVPHPDDSKRLFLAGLHWLQNRGQEWVILESWGDAPETLDVYRALGLEQTQEEREYVL